MNIGNFQVPNNPYRLPRLVEHIKKIYDSYKGDVIQNAKKNDTLAQLCGYKSSNNGAYWGELAALRAYGLLEGRSDLRVSDLAKQITYGNEQQKSEALLKSVLNIPLWKELYNRHRLQLPTQEFWAKLANITGCEAPVAKSNESFITEAFIEDTKDIKHVKQYTTEAMDLTPPDQEDVEPPRPTVTQFIEVKAGPFYQRLPFTEQGKKVAMEFLQSLEISETKKEK